MASKQAIPAHPRPAAMQPREHGRPANNTTCDVYHAGNAPPAAADVSTVACHLWSDFRAGSEAGEAAADFRWTHILYVDAGVDLRDNWPTAPNTTVYVPDKDGTGFDVVFVELVNRGTPAQYKRAYLKRKAPTWPTNEL